MTAKEARELALNSTEVQFNEVMNDITTHVKIGCFICHQYKELQKPVISKLKELGYDVIDKDGYNHFTITW